MSVTDAPLPAADPLLTMLHDAKIRRVQPQMSSLTVRSGLCTPNGQLKVMPGSRSLWYWRRLLRSLTACPR